MTDGFIPYQIPYRDPEQMTQDSRQFYHHMDKRRSVREFSTKPVPKIIIENLLLTASTAPSGANKQPWTFCAVSNQDIKKQIRLAAEKEEHENYHGRMGEEWLNDLAALGTNEEKPFLEHAPWLIVVFKKAYDADGITKKKNYYVSESVGIACGVLLTAIYQSGLVALTHTPSPMNFLKKLLKRPDHETPYLLIPVGYPASTVYVPDIKRKTLSEFTSWYE